MSVHRFDVTEPAPTGLGSHRFQVVQGAGVPVNITVEGGGGGGAVDSVNGQTGVVVLDAADVGAATAAQGATADSAVQPGDLATVATTGAYADLTGKPTLGTAAAAATTDFATAAQGAKADTAVQPADITALIGAAPAALDTLSELADALGDDANFAATVTTALAGKQPLDADLTAIAALVTTAYGRGFLTLADQAALVALLPSYQPLDADLTALAAAGNSATLAATTAAFTTADETKLDGIEAGADVTDATNVAAAGAVMKVAAGAAVEDLGAVEYRINTVAATGAAETLDTSVYGVHDCTMDQNCEFTFSNPAPSGKLTEFVLILRGAFTPTFPAAVDWSGGAAPTYASPSKYVFSTVDAGTTYLGVLAGSGFA